jgi:hypothetical protein
MLTVCGIATRPMFVADGTVQPREYLSLTVSVNHDVVDGAPAARFVQRLKELLESGCGLAAATAAAVSNESLQGNPAPRYAASGTVPDIAESARVFLLHGRPALNARRAP